VDKDITTTIFLRDETIALSTIEPLDSTIHRHTYSFQAYLNLRKAFYLPKFTLGLLNSTQPIDPVNGFTGKIQNPNFPNPKRGKDKVWLSSAKREKVRK